MKPEWECTSTASALPGALLGAALGADCLLALSERGTMLILTCAYGEEIKEEAARETLLYMLENLQFTGPAIMEENYRDQLHPVVSIGFNDCGQALFKAPEGLFPCDAYLDTFHPCGGEVRYFDGGISMMIKVHGLRVSAAVVPNEGTALDVVREVYEDLKAAGRQHGENDFLEDAYHAEGNKACLISASPPVKALLSTDIPGRAAEPKRACVQPHQAGRTLFSAQTVKNPLH